MATPRDVELWLEMRVEESLGDRSPAATVAPHLGMSAESARQQRRRIDQRLRRLLASDGRYAGLAEVAGLVDAASSRMTATAGRTVAVASGPMTVTAGWGATGLGPLAGPAGLAVAWARHPSSRSGRPDALGLAGRVCARLAPPGAIVAEVAAAVSATRGQWGWTGAGSPR